MNFDEMTNIELLNLWWGLDLAIYKAECYGVSEVTRLMAVSEELVKRGVEV